MGEDKRIFLCDECHIYFTYFFAVYLFRNNINRHTYVYLCVCWTALLLDCSVFCPLAGDFWTELYWTRLKTWVCYATKVRKVQTVKNFTSPSRPTNRDWAEMLSACQGKDTERKSSHSDQWSSPPYKQVYSIYLLVFWSAVWRALLVCKLYFFDWQRYNWVRICLSHPEKKLPVPTDSEKIPTVLNSEKFSTWNTLLWQILFYFIFPH